MPKVAIIGAGPSGLVTAKTLLHDFAGFSPVIFDSQHQIGGLWNEFSDSTDQLVTLDPWMSTNLSRFTVAFSDLDWQSVGDDIPMFPQARQVGQYLAEYANRYIPDNVCRLGCKVVTTERKVSDEGVKWEVQWLQGPSAEHLCSEVFDLLVIASGYFAEQYIPPIQGLEQSSDCVIHSSTLHRQWNVSRNFEQIDTDTILVIGGSMSGVEAASTLALNYSSSLLSLNKIPTTNSKVYHIHSRPFWALPTYLPYDSGDKPSFQALDLAMYDLARRPPGAIDYALGPIPEEKTVRTNSYFQTLLGGDYEKHAHLSTGQTQTQPSWIAIGNDYAELVRAGTIQASMGRVVSLKSDNGLASVQYAEPNGNIKTIDNVGKIVMATGFTPFKALSMLPKDVLSQLEYSATDTFSPLVLNKGGTIRSEVPDLGFVGFYRGPYWGIMEMQARFLGKLWSGTETVYTEDQQCRLRDLRAAHPDLARGQFPMGDYVGLMETFAKDLDINRQTLDGDSRAGPAIPSRYLYRSKSQGNSTESEAQAMHTLHALRDALKNDGAAAQQGAASAIFRALHGNWNFERTSGTDETSGTLSFYPRHATSPAYDREYVVGTCASITGDESVRSHSIMRLTETRSHPAPIEMWSVDLSDGFPAARVSESWHLMPLRRKMIGEQPVPGEYLISVKSVGPSGNNFLYTFHFQGVSISSWECVELTCSNGTTELDGMNHTSSTVYKR